MVAIWERFLQKQIDKTEQAVENQQQNSQSLGDRIAIYQKFNLEIREERGSYGSSPSYRPAPRTRYIQRYF